MPDTAGRPQRGIFGGTFNPVHRCHIEVAQACAAALSLDEVVLVPANQPPHRDTDLAPATNRLRMVELAIDGDPLLSASACELQRSGPSYTIDTVDHLLADTSSDWTLILGLDAMLGLDHWHRPETLVRKLPIAVLFRPGAEFAALAELRTLATVSFSGLTGWDHQQPLTCRSHDGITVVLVPVPPCPASASSIRQALQTHHPNPPGLTESVRDYIIEHQLYA